MKAMILAAGKSTRLGALGAQTPKPMLPLSGRPVLEWTLETLRAAGIRHVAINLHHAPEVIPNYFGDGSDCGVNLTYFHETEILGTAGAVRNARAFLEDGEPFLLIYGDNVLSWDPRPMLDEHRTRGPLATIAVAQIPDPSRSGVVQFSSDGTILAFHEKPGHRPELGNWVNAAVYVLSPKIFDFIPAEGLVDFGYDVFPAALASGAVLRVYRLDSPPLAIDTPEMYLGVKDLTPLGTGPLPCGHSPASPAGEESVRGGLLVLYRPSGPRPVRMY